MTTTEVLTFAQEVEDAYEHLYDLVHLRNHRLLLLLTSETENRKERAWALHHLLLNMIQELDPGSGTPIQSREWRRHRLLSLRYVDGLSPQVVAEQLSISRRHYYREQKLAVDAIADLLWERFKLTEHAAPVENSSAERMALVRSEASLAASQQPAPMLDELIDAVLVLLDEQIQRQGIRITLDLPERLPHIVSSTTLLRQMLMAALGSVIGQMQPVAIILRAEEMGDPAVRLMFLSPGITGLPGGISELAELANVTVVAVEGGFAFDLPVAHKPTILVVDDNEDTLSLMRRYLTLNQYQAVTARDVREALQIAPQIQPSAIILDLMMPEQDGWDLLQQFKHQPETRAVPIIVCSVLRQKDLALSLGARAFLEKPVTEEALMGVLGTLER